MILIVAGLLLVLVSVGFMMFANALDGLGGMGNPSAEMQEQSRQASNFRNTVLVILIVSGGAFAVLSLMFFPRGTPEQTQPHRNKINGSK